MHIPLVYSSVSRREQPNACPLLAALRQVDVRQNARGKTMNLEATEGNPQGGPAPFLHGASLDRAVPLREQVYALLRSAIVLGKLRPGAPISEIEIAGRLGISRTPVREAVKKLADEAMVEVFAQNGAFVAGIVRARLEESYIIRIALEIESISRAAAVIRKSHIFDLEDIIDAHETALRRQHFEDAIARDDEFHRYIAEVNGLTMLWKAVDLTKAQMDRCRLLALPSPGAGQETIAQHRTILDRLAVRDAEGSREAMRAHLQTSLRNTLALLEAVPRHPALTED